MSENLRRYRQKKKIINCNYNCKLIHLYNLNCLRTNEKLPIAGRYIMYIQLHIFNLLKYYLHRIEAEGEDGGFKKKLICNFILKIFLVTLKIRT